MRRKPDTTNYNFDRLLRTFRSKVKRSGLMEDIRKKEYYEKPAQRKQRLKEAAIRRESKRERDSRPPPLRAKDRIRFKKR